MCYQSSTGIGTLNSVKKFSDILKPITPDAFFLAFCKKSIHNSKSIGSFDLILILWLPISVRIGYFRTQ